LDFGLSLTADITTRLLAYTLAPLVLSLLTFLLAYVWHRIGSDASVTLQPWSRKWFAAESIGASSAALPVLVLLFFFLSPPISSFAFFVVRDCDCSEPATSDAQRFCFMPVDLSVQCPPDGKGLLSPLIADYPMYLDSQDVAWGAIWAYAVGPPLVFGALLCASRHAITGTSTTLSLSLSFLYREYRDSLWFWELIVSFLKQCLVGFLSLSVFDPGSPMQLLTATVLTTSYLALVGWVQPYRVRQTNALAVISTAVMQFLFLAFLAYEIQNKGLALGGFHDVLFGTSVVFIITLFVLLLAFLVRYIIS